MSLLTAVNLAKSYGPEDIFSGVSLSVPPRARIALVGPNGAGKTSLLRILAGEEPPSQGQVQRARGGTIGYLPQEARFGADHTLWQECLAALKDLRAQEAELARLEARISASPDDEELLERYGSLQQAFERAGGYTYETRIRQALDGLGFSQADRDMPLTRLSGGQRTRAVLARLLLSQPDLLILDEPTNHLDIAAVEWLEGALRGWNGAFVLVSHDRYFMDRVAETIWELGPAGFESYRGNYSAYLGQRRDRWEQRRQFYESEMARMEKELDYIRRNIAGQRTQQAKGKLSRLSRQIRAIETHGFDGVRGRQWSEIGSAGRPMGVEEAHQRLKSLRGPQGEPPRLNLRVRPRDRSGEIVLRASGLTVGYPGKPLFSLDELELRRLECAALIGPNGAGKTTFLRAILGRVEPLAGELKPGAGLRIGYFAQGHGDLDPELTLMQEIERAAPGMLPAEVRSYLGGFLFSGDEHLKRVGALSGGERGRLALAKLALTDANLLLLDEPTNHLDIPSQEVLQGMLAEYQGTILLVSHDRYLIDALATQVWEIDVQAKALKVFKGSYSEYRREGEPQTVGEEAREAEPSEGRPSERPSRPSKNEQQRRLWRIAALEERIAGLELRLVEIGRELENPPDGAEQVQALGEEYANVEKELEEVIQAWEELHD